MLHNPTHLNINHKTYLASSRATCWNGASTTSRPRAASARSPSPPPRAARASRAASPSRSPRPPASASSAGHFHSRSRGKPSKLPITTRFPEPKLKPTPLPQPQQGDIRPTSQKLLEERTRSVSGHPRIFESKGSEMGRRQGESVVCSCLVKNTTKINTRAPPHHFLSCAYDTRAPFLLLGCLLVHAVAAMASHPSPFASVVQGVCACTPRRDAR